MDQNEAVITLEEPVDVIRLNKLIDYLTSFEPSSSYLPRLLEYKKHVKFAKICVDYNYCDSLKSEKLGRLYSRKGVSLQMLGRQVRNFLAQPFGFDVDFENAQPRILFKVAKDRNWPCNALSRYVSNREKILEEIMRTYQVERVNAKELILAMMFLGKLRNWEDDNIPTIHKESIMSSSIRRYLTELEHELLDIAQNVANSMPELVKVCKHKEPGSSHWELLSSVLSTFCLTEENKILMLLYEYLVKKGRRIITLIYDGLIIQKQPDETSFPDELLLKAEKYIFVKSGYSMKLAIKPFESKYDHLGASKKLSKEQMDNSHTLTPWMNCA